MVNYEEINPIDITLADNRIVKAIGVGDIHLIFKTKAGFAKVLMKEVLFVPELGNNLFSVSKVASLGFEVIFGDKNCRIKRGNKLLVEGFRKGGLYLLNCEINYASIASDNISIEIWHHRLGHISKDTIRHMMTNKMVDGLSYSDITKDTVCEGCAKGKMSRRPFPNTSTNRSTKTLQLVHTDVCGPMQTKTFSGKRYFLTFIDDYSRFTVCYLLEHKSEVYDKFVECEALVTNMTSNRIKMLRSDEGCEYRSKKFNAFCKGKGIIQQFTASYTPQQNGVAERMNRTIVEAARCMLQAAQLDNKYWDEAVQTAVYLQNRSSTKALTNITPYEAWFGKKPDLSNLRVFGCQAYAHILIEKRQKLDANSTKCIFLGYSESIKAYRLQEVKTGKLVISRDVIFSENLIMKSNETQRNCNDLVNEDGIDIVLKNKEGLVEATSNETSKTNETSKEPRRSDRHNKGVPPDRFGFSKQLAQFGANSDDLFEFAFTTVSSSCGEPTSWTEAMNSAES
ncbi:retrovirus-related Pol polyprotein from transposon TNT 1-94-like protein, partial [Dinothrombium tinctorium]